MRGPETAALENNMDTKYAAYKADEHQFEVRQLSNLSPAEKDTRKVFRGGGKELASWLYARPPLRAPSGKPTTSELILAELDEQGLARFVVPWLAVSKLKPLHCRQQRRGPPRQRLMSGLRRAHLPPG